MVGIIAFACAVWLGRAWEHGDDAYITWTYAVHLARGDGFVFSPGAPPSLGTTTPLWCLIFAAIAKAGIAPPSQHPSSLESSGPPPRC